jgi:hypothetical protein
MGNARFSDLWNLHGTVDRGPYLGFGLGLLGLKYNLDRLVASIYFQRPWTPLRYLAPAQGGHIDTLASDDLRFFGALLLLAAPFIYSGVALTLRRLRAVQLPLALVMLFFVPAVNFLFFALLAVLPTVAGQPADPKESPRRLLGRLFPQSALGSAVAALLLVLPTAGLLTVGSVRLLKSYGWGLFVGLPFALGLASALLHGYHQPRSLRACLAVAVTAVTLLGGLLLALAIEGVFCLVMAWPLGAALGLLGGVVGYLIQRRPLEPNRQGPGAGASLLLLAVLLPALMGAESTFESRPALIPVRTAVVVDAPPQKVWPHVVAFSELPPPDHLLFRIGIAYPQRAVIYGHGVGAVRHCMFSTGPFVEPIEVWDEPRLLKFAVTAQPPAMQELSPWGKIDAPHISSFLVSEGGQFLLTALPGGRTRLEGTTWYRHRIWPADYWRLWSDWILHSIHQRVLDHVKREAEAAG